MVVWATSVLILIEDGRRGKCRKSYCRGRIINININIKSLIMKLILWIVGGGFGVCEARRWFQWVPETFGYFYQVRVRLTSDLWTSDDN